MKLKKHNFKIPITSINNDKDIVKQESIVIQEHAADLKYKILAQNTFGGRTVHCPGYFNNKTNFIIGEVSSILSMTPSLDIIVKDTSELINSKNFMIYPIPCFNMVQNYTLEYIVKDGDKKINIDLTMKLGETIGKYLANQSNVINLPEGFLELFINTKNGISLNKNILINSNYRFVIGILKGYRQECNTHGIYILPNVNIYTFSTILNYLGASYSIRNSKNNTKKVYVQLPNVYDGLIDSLFIKNEEYVIPDKADEVVLKKQFQLKDTIYNYDNSLFKGINSGKILLVPYDSIDFIPVENERVYDLTAERSDATNYSMGFTPFLKNSDGDILAASGIFTKEGLQSSQVFSPDSKEYYRDLNDGNINQWISDDAILGLYNATK